MNHLKIFILFVGSLNLISLSVSVQLPWEKPQILNRGLPSSVVIYTLNTSQSPFGGKLTGGYARFNMNDTNLQFVVKDTNGDALGYFPKTPIQYADQQENVVYAVINGGYFDMTKNISVSFIAQQSKIKCKNSINQGTNIYITNGAFALTKEGKYQIQYIYSFGSNFTTYKYPYPNPYPGPKPNQQDGKIWQVVEGLGAGPILVKNRSIISGNPQHFNTDLMLNFHHPRSAICFDSNNYIYFVAIDGKYEGSAGLTIAQLSQVMSGLNCFNALNLDGGGSALLYANSKIINRPSDPAGPRKVVSAILIRDRYKKKSFITTQ